ncbi:6-hydroxy-d-nicotine oxidase [Apiospora saccharicola]|uniref:6-hydroxy-d-nicotine oxidase n=1 Tax=Apiospora saccharicola TaxID=335842 RepID=A0ABR1UPA2_9PEZI
MKKATDVHERLVAGLKACVADGDVITNCIFHPMPSVVAKRTAVAGGNLMGMERITENAVLFDPEQVFQKLCPGGWKIPGI